MFQCREQKMERLWQLCNSVNVLVLSDEIFFPVKLFTSGISPSNIFVDLVVAVICSILYLSEDKNGRIEE